MLKLRKGKGAKSIFFSTKQPTPYSKELKTAFFLAISFHLLGLGIFTIVRPNFVWRTQPESMVLLIEDSEQSDAKGEIASEKGRINSLQTLLDFEWKIESQENPIAMRIPVEWDEEMIAFLDEVYTNALNELPVSKKVEKPPKILLSGPDAEAIDDKILWAKLQPLLPIAFQPITAELLINKDTAKVIWIAFKSENSALNQKIKQALLQETFVFSDVNKELLSVQLHIF